MLRPISLLGLMAVLTLGTGCSSYPEDPVDVAGRFWAEIGDGDIEGALRYATRDSRDHIKPNENACQGELQVKFGEVTEEHGAVLVATTLAASGAGADPDMALKTVLVRYLGEWRVDFPATMQTMFDGEMGQLAREMSEAMGRAMETAMEQMSQDMQKSMEEFSQRTESCSGIQ